MHKISVILRPLFLLVLLVFIDYGSHCIYRLSMVLQYINILLAPICAYMYALARSCVSNTLQLVYNCGMLKKIYDGRRGLCFVAYIISFYLVLNKDLSIDPLIALRLIGAVSTILLLCYTLSDTICKYAAIIWLFTISITFNFVFYAPRLGKWFIDLELPFTVIMCLFSLYIVYEAIIDYKNNKNIFTQNIFNYVLLMLISTAIFFSMVMCYFINGDGSVVIAPTIISVSMYIYLITVIVLDLTFICTLITTNKHQRGNSKYYNNGIIRLLIIKIKRIF